MGNKKDGKYPRQIAFYYIIKRQKNQGVNPY